MHQAQWSPERPLPPPVSLASQSHHEKPPEVTCTSRGNPGLPASTRESPRETFFNTSRGQIPLPWLGSKLLSRVRLFATPWTVAHQAPPSMGFSRQEYWSGLPFPSPGDLPNPGIESRSPTLQADALPSEPPGKLQCVQRPWSDGTLVEVVPVGGWSSGLIPDGLLVPPAPQHECLLTS